MKHFTIKRNRISIILLIVYVCLGVGACEEESPPVVQDQPSLLKEVIFEISSSGANAGMGIQSIKEGPSQAVMAEIWVEGVDSPYYSELIFKNGRYHTKGFGMKAGNYTIERFLLLDENGHIVMAAPEAGSALATEVQTPVNFTTVISEKDKTTTIEIEVIDFTPASYQDFGFDWFAIACEICIFGDLCLTGNPYYTSNFTGSLYENVPGGLQIDMAAIFKIYAYSGDTLLPGYPYSNEPWLGVGQPLCFDYIAYPYMPEKSIEIQLWILSPDGMGGFAYQPYYTIETNKSGKIKLNNGGDGVIDFVVGDCVHGDIDLTLEWKVPIH